MTRKIHHTAYVFPRLKDGLAKFTSGDDWEKISQTVLDTKQGVLVCFVTMKDGTMIELLEPFGAKSPVETFLRKHPEGSKYHECYEVPDLDAEIKLMQEQEHYFVVKSAVPAPAIKNRRVAFLMNQYGQLVELIEADA